MSKRISEHLRSNVVGYVAIFLFAVGGTAYATHPGGANTISSADIIDNTVRTNDIRDGNLATADIDTNAVVSGKIADGEVRSADVLDDSLTGADVNDGSLTDADTSGLVPYGDILWAVVNSDGSLNRASNATTTSALEAAGTGDYEVDFGDGSLDPCASVAQISFAGFPFSGSPGEAASAQGENVSNTIDVRTWDDAGASADRGFTVHVLCPEGFGGAAAAASADRGRR